MGRTATYQLVDQHRTSSILLCHLCLTLQVWHLASFSQVWDLDFSVITLPYLLSLLGENLAWNLMWVLFLPPCLSTGSTMFYIKGIEKRVWILISRAQVKQHYDRSPRVPNFPSFLSSIVHFIWLFCGRAYVPPHMCLSTGPRPELGAKGDLASLSLDIPRVFSHNDGKRTSTVSGETFRKLLTITSSWPPKNMHFWCTDSSMWWRSLLQGHVNK